MHFSSLSYSLDFSGQSITSYALGLYHFYNYSNWVYLDMCALYSINYSVAICIIIFCRYRISATSPSRVDPLVWGYLEIFVWWVSKNLSFVEVINCFSYFVQIGSEKSYEILCKTFKDNAKAILEVCLVFFLLFVS